MLDNIPDLELNESNRSTAIRWGYYGLSCLVEGFDAGSYLYGFGGNSTVFGLGLLGPAVLTTTILTSISGALVGLGIAYQAYQMKKNEETLQKNLKKFLINQKQQLLLEYQYFLQLQKDFNEIQKHNMPDLRSLIVDLVLMEKRLTLNMSDDFSIETKQAAAIYQPYRQELKKKIKSLQFDASVCYAKNNFPFVSYATISQPSPLIQSKDNSKDKSKLIWRGILAFILISTVTICTGFLFATPMGALALIGTILGACAYVYAAQANDKLDKKVADAEIINDHMEAQISKIEDIKTKLELISNPREEAKAEFLKKPTHSTSSTRRMSQSFSLSEKDSPVLLDYKDSSENFNTSSRFSSLSAFVPKKRSSDSTQNSSPLTSLSDARKVEQRPPALTRSASSPQLSIR